MLTRTEEGCSLLLLRASGKKIQQFGNNSWNEHSILFLCVREGGRNTGKGKPYWHTEFGLSGNNWWCMEELRCVLHRSIWVFCMFKQLSFLLFFLGSEAVWTRESSSMKLGVSISISIPGHKHVDFKNHLLCGRQFPSPSSQVRERQVVSWHNPGQPWHGGKVNANPEQTRMGNKIRVNAGLSQTKPHRMLKLTFAVICIYITPKSKVPQAAIAAWMSV